MSFQVTRNGFPIRDYALPSVANAGIAYSMEFSGFEACVAAGLDLEKWTENKYSVKFKSKIIAWYGLAIEVKNHQQDAVQKKQESMSKRRKK